jgi:replicative DNA helicase
MSDIHTIYGKVQPQAIPLEEAVLGALMLDRDAVMTVIDSLSPESFYLEAHQNIYKAILSLFNQSSPVDLLTVTEELRKAGTLEKCGGPYYLVELSNRVASAANIEYHARIIQQKWMQRKLIEAGGLILQEAYRDTTDIFEMIGDAEKAIFDITSGASKKDAKGAGQIAGDVLRNAEKAMKKKQEGGITGIPSGLIELDNLTGGFQNSDLIILAARPGMGKTGLVLTIASAAAKADKPVGFFSLEMSETQLIGRLVGSESGVSSNRMMNGSLHDSDLLLIQEATEKMNGLKLFIDDSSALSIVEVRAKARRMMMKHKIQLLIVDYLQLMVSKDKNGNREQEVSKISQGLKSLAKDLNIPIIALSQLSRAVEIRGGAKRPQLSDLRDSGSIEQDADIVSFIYRPEYYSILEDESGRNLKGIAEIIIEKHRNGPTGTIEVRFEEQFARFTDLKSAQFPGSATVQNTVPDWSPTAGIPATRSEPLDVPF